MRSQKKIIIPKSCVARIGLHEADYIDQVISFAKGFDSESVRRGELTCIFNGLVLRTVVDVSTISATLLLRDEEVAKQYSDEATRIAQEVRSTCVQREKDIPKSVAYVFMCDGDDTTAASDYVAGLQIIKTFGYSGRTVELMRRSLATVPSGKPQNNSSPRIRV